MRLLFLSNLFPPYDLGGYEQWAHEIAAELAGRGHAVHVLTSRHRIEEGRPESDGRFNVRRSLHLQAGIEHYRPLHFFTRRSREERHNVAEVAKAVRESAPDLVLVWGMWNLSFGIPARAEALLPGRVAYFVSSYWPEDPDPHRAYWAAPERKLLARLLKTPAGAVVKATLAREDYPPGLEFQHVRCCSVYVRDRLVRTGSLPARAGVLYGGIDPAPFLQPSGEADGPLRLLYFGSLIPQKGVRTALQALALLRDSGLGDALQLTILGSGHSAYKAALQGFVRQHGIADMVRFVPRVPRTSVPEQLRASDVFLFTSVWPEPMARTVMEAMAAGLLVIGSEVGGQVEMLSAGRNALTFPPGDAEALARQIRAALEQPGLRRSLAEAGRRTVLERFTLVRMADDMEAWLETILS